MTIFGEFTGLDSGQGAKFYKDGKVTGTVKAQLGPKEVELADQAPMATPKVSPAIK